MNQTALTIKTTTDSPETDEFSPSERAESILRDGDILAEDESPEAMLDRVAGVIPSIEQEFGLSEDMAQAFADQMRTLFQERKIVPSTPIMTNAQRFDHRPLSACSVPPVDLDSDYETLKDTVDTYHQEGMGTGFALDEASDPIETLIDLQEIAKTGLETEKQHRPVGNMGIMRIDHPKIREFITIKQQTQDKDWKFNLSVNITDAFMEAYENDEPFELRDGTTEDPQELMDLMVNCAWDCADPGLIFLGNMNRRRPFDGAMNYVSVAPCGEVGLAEGETCQFASINIAAFLEDGEIDYEELKHATYCVTRFLDDVLEYSIQHYTHEESIEAMRTSRKIGIGFCGYSKLLTKMGLVYDSEQANQILRDLLSFINYHSKHYSKELADSRGSFDGWEESLYSDPDTDFLTEKFGDADSQTVSRKDWQQLDRAITEQGLRNSTTVILPPTGRSSLTFDTSQSIEPIFSLSDQYDTLNEEFVQTLEDRDLAGDEVLESVRENGSCQHLDLPTDIKQVFRTAVEISYEQHFNVLVEAQRFVDESVSKTINLPKDADPAAVEQVYRRAYQEGLNGMTVYRNGSAEEQPMDLKEEDQ
ncbi:MAG: hypothetical protein MUP66_00135 [Candidatus Nanohaloarchaeota archaeon QJJ-5]|nr:hypothetical protein [Candidatus Nanohaloarchaeota archaeon QJJ-5]